MLIASAVFIAFGFLIIRQINVNHRAMFYLKGTLFRNQANVMIMDILCFALFVAGPMMINFLPLPARIGVSAALAFFLLNNVRKRSESAIAHKIVMIYKAVKFGKPEANEQDSLRETMSLYWKSIGVHDASINSYLTGIFSTRDDDPLRKGLVEISKELNDGKKISFDLDIRGAISLVLNYHNDLSCYANFLELEKVRNNAIEMACIQEGLLVNSIGGHRRTMKFANWTEAQVKRWLWLRAVEWAAFPAYVSQPLVPIMFIFFPWYWVIATVVVLGILWSLIRYSYVNVTIANIACILVVWAKWPCAIGSTIYLFLHHQPIPGLVALLWPLLGGFIGVPGKVGVIELAFAKRIGFVPQDTEL